MAQPMKRPSVYPYKNTAVPGVTVHNLREKMGWSLRELADHCNPQLDHSTIRRIENDEGWTRDTLERVAKALGVDVPTLFLPPEFGEFTKLPKDVQERLRQTMMDAIAAYTFRSHKS